MILWYILYHYPTCRIGYDTLVHVHVHFILLSYMYDALVHVHFILLSYM